MGCEKGNLAMDSFGIIWNSTMEEIADSYLPGTFDFLAKYRPKLYEEISLAEKVLNRDWKKQRMVAFKIDIKNWQKLMQKGIEEFERKPLPRSKELPKELESQTAEPEAPRRKTFFEVFQDMKTREENL